MASVVFGMGLCLNHLMYFVLWNVYILLKISSEPLEAFWGFVVLFFTGLSCFTLKTDSDIHDGGYHSQLTL